MQHRDNGIHYFKLPHKHGNTVQVIKILLICPHVKQKWWTGLQFLFCTFWIPHGPRMEWPIVKMKPRSKKLLTNHQLLFTPLWMLYQFFREKDWPDHWYQQISPPNKIPLCKCSWIGIKVKIAKMERVRLSAAELKGSWTLLDPISPRVILLQGNCISSA